MSKHTHTHDFRIIYHTDRLRTRVCQCAIVSKSILRDFFPFTKSRVISLENDDDDDDDDGDVDDSFAHRIYSIQI